MGRAHGLTQVRTTVPVRTGGNAIDDEGLLAETAIRRGLHRYATAVDRGQWDLLETVFAPDADLDYTASSGPRCGPEELADWLVETIGQIPIRQHHLTNIAVEVDGDEATSTTYLLNPLAGDDGQAFLLLGGVYEDRWRHTDDGWRIVHRVHRLTWGRGDMPDGLRLGPV